MEQINWDPNPFSYRASEGKKKSANENQRQNSWSLNALLKGSIPIIDAGNSFTFCTLKVTKLFKACIKQHPESELP